MRRALPLLVAALALGPWSASPFAQSADEIIEQHLAAVGGREALERIASRVSRCTIALSTPAGVGRGLAIALVGLEPLGDGEAYVFDAMSTSGATARFFVDAASFMLVRAVMSIDVPELGGPVEQVSEFSDFREAAASWWRTATCRATSP